MPEQQVDEEEETQEKSNTKRAFFAGINKADTFTGSFRGVPSIKHGGAASVRPEDTLGDETHCWCGELLGHSWPGKEQGVRHPRGETVSATAAEKPYLKPRDIRVYDRRVVRALCELVNTYGVEYRIMTNNHVILTAPGSTGKEIDERLKTSPSRAPENQLKMIERWAEKFVRPAKVAQAATVLAEKFNDPTKKPHQKASSEPVAPEPTPEPGAPQIKPEPASAPGPGGSEPVTFDGGSEPPEGFHQHHGQKHGEPTNWWEADGGGEWRCKSCGFVVKGRTLRGGGPHQVMHLETQEVRSERSRQAAAHRDPEQAGKRARARNAIKFLAEEYGIELVDDRKGAKATREVASLEKKVASLEAKLAAVTAERDDATTKLAMAKEVFGL